MLVKVAETSLSNSRAKRICAEFVRAVTRNNDTHLLASLEMPEISENDKDLDLLYRNIADAPVASVGGAYEEIFHKLYILSVRAQAIENRLSVALKTYESELAHKS